MNSCNYENWSLKEVSEALENRQKEGRIIKVPLFQRSIVWKEEQSKMFIDSLKKGFPIGTLLFAKSVQDSQEVFTLIDGLQRSSTIKKYIQNPTQFFGSLDIDDTLIYNINKILGQSGNQKEIIQKIKDCLIDFIKKSDDISDIQYLEFAYALAEIFPILNEKEKLRLVGDTVKPFIKEYKDNFATICNAKIPIIIYSGEEKYLPDIFARINNQGTALTKYQIYAASWSIEGKITVNHPKIVDSILKKYDAMVDEGFELQDYNRDELKITKQFSIFEYVFGFGKYLCDEFPELFEKDRKVEEINPIGFELINACFGKSSDEIKNLYLHIKEVDIAKFETCVIDTIKWVLSILKPYIAFVGNTRNKMSIFHAKNQIISIIASTFLEKYDINNLEISKKTWKENKKILEKNIPLHYVYDILSQEWADGGIGRIYSIINNNKYLQIIPKQSWEAMLNNWFTLQLNRQEVKNVANPKLSDLLFLNCIYTDIFSAKDQLSKVKYDVEHIATKNYMKNIIKTNEWQGQPISCIANLCYLPEQANRTKKDKNFYQDIKYLDKISLSDVEQKFSFTKAEDLSWMDLEFDAGEYSLFSDKYVTFLKKRFEIQKEKFYESMQIN